jgi:hypothetical protein
LTTPNLSAFGWLSALASPAIMVLAWLGVGEALRAYLGPSLLAAGLAAAGGGIAGLGSLLAFEAGVGKDSQRWETLRRLIELTLQKAFG